MVVKFVTTFLNYLGMRLTHHGHLLVLASFPGHMGWEGRGPRPHGVGGEGPQATWGGRGGATQHGTVYLLLYNKTVTRVKRTEVRILLASLQEIVGHGW